MEGVLKEGGSGVLQVVGVIFRKTIAVYQVSARGMAAERTCVVADPIFGVDQISPWQALLLSFRRSYDLHLYSRWLEIFWKPWDCRPL